MSTFSALKGYLRPAYHYKTMKLTFIVNIDKGKLIKMINSAKSDATLYYLLGGQALTKDIKLIDWMDVKEVVA